MTGTITCPNGHEFDPVDAVTLEIPSATLVRCPECGRWTEREQSDQ